MFDENKHPRDGDGKFADGNRESKTEKLERAERIYNDEPSSTRQEPIKKNKAKSKEEFFGEEFKGYKGAEAIEKLLKEKRGHIKNAFERPEIGGIDLVWGDNTGGLGHTIMRRAEQLQAGTGTTSGIDIARKIPEIIEKGKFALGAGDRPNFTYNDYLVVVRPAFDGEKVNWVVTAMEPQK